MTKYGRIYIIRNKVNDKVYVGQTTVSLKLRFQNHLSAARRGLDYVIGKAIRKYGEENFYIELLEEYINLDYDKEVLEEIEIECKYEGYIKRQEQQVKQFKKLENKRIPAEIDYRDIKSLRLEAVQKLNLVKPESIGQASRISGVSPADISVLLVWLEAKR